MKKKKKTTKTTKIIKITKITKLKGKNKSQANNHVMQSPPPIIWITALRQSDFIEMIVQIVGNVENKKS